VRFDKDLWQTSCTEYNQGTVTAADTAHFTPAARALVSVWLELLQDNRAPASRILGTLALPDLVSELRRASELIREPDGPIYRFRAAIQQVERRVEVLHLDYPGRTELLRLTGIAADYRLLREAKEDRPKQEHGLRLKYRLEKGVEVEKYLVSRIQQLAVAIHGRLRDRNEYRDALVTQLRRILLGQALAFWELCYRGTPIIEELLAFALDRGSSIEALAELPIKYLRADRQDLDDGSLEARLRLALGAFRSAPQRYQVYLPLEGPQLTIPGEIFPPGITLLGGEDWVTARASFQPLGNQLAGSTQAVAVEIDDYLTRFAGETSSPPRDVFAARDLALRAARQCLDAIFLYRGRTARLSRFCGIEAHQEEAHQEGGAQDAAADQQSGDNQEEAGDHGPHRQILDLERGHHDQGPINMPFVRPVPLEWADALYWYRIGATTAKHEAGIVHLWTAAEILAEESHDLRGTNFGRVLRSIGIVVPLFLLLDEQLYLARAALVYAGRFERTARMHAPVDPSIPQLIEWWVNLCLQETPDTLLQEVFDLFPHLAFEAEQVKHWSMYGSDLYARHKQRVVDTLAWIYACRNDVVHEGRERVAGAAIAHRLLAEYLSLTLQRTLSSRARGSCRIPAEAFLLAAEVEATVNELLSQHKLVQALRYLA
jgi:hypothetical protein